MELDAVDSLKAEWKKEGAHIDISPDTRRESINAVICMIYSLELLKVASIDATVAEKAFEEALRIGTTAFGCAETAGMIRRGVHVDALLLNEALKNGQLDADEEVMAIQELARKIAMYTRESEKLNDEVRSLMEATEDPVPLKAYSKGMKSREKNNIYKNNPSNCCSPVFPRCNIRRYTGSNSGKR